MDLHNWLARFGSRRVDRRQVGLLGAALAALLVDGELESDAARRRRKAQRERPAHGKPERRPRHCGGIAGIPCPAGFTCVDDPGDDCDPQAGGADCFGICMREVEDRCAAAPCRKGTRCCPQCGAVCVPDDVSCREWCASTPCNEATCGPGEYCCNESCSLCVPRGQVCTAEVCPPDDPGGERCGKNRCERGEYCCNPSCGVCAPLNGGCAAVYCPPEPEPEPEPGEPCGKTVCPRGLYCCNSSCGICAPPNAACMMIACVDEMPE